MPVDIEDLQRRVEELERRVMPVPAHAPMYQGPPLPFTFPATLKCSKCGLALSPVMGYVCPQVDCPTGLGGVMCLSDVGVCHAR